MLIDLAPCPDVRERSPPITILLPVADRQHARWALHPADRIVAISLCPPFPDDPVAAVRMLGSVTNVRCGPEGFSLPVTGISPRRSCGFVRKRALIDTSSRPGGHRGARLKWRRGGVCNAPEWFCTACAASALTPDDASDDVQPSQMSHLGPTVERLPENDTTVTLGVAADGWLCNCHVRVRIHRPRARQCVLSPRVGQANSCALRVVVEPWRPRDRRLRPGHPLRGSRGARTRSGWSGAPR